MKEIIDLSEIEWKKIRPDQTIKVFGKSLIPEHWSDVKAVITKVEPGGEFHPHIDNYHHVSYFLQGEGEGFVENEKYIIKPNLKVIISAGLKHGYKNTHNEDLILLTINIPKI